MEFIKKHLDDIVRCYCTSHMFIDDKCYLFFASENPNSECYSYTGKDFNQRETVWDKDRGGCMSIIPFKDRKGEFLSVNEFYLKVSPSAAKLVWGKKTDTGWLVKDLFNLPYLHRFDIYHINNKDYLVCATIARDKAFKDDWSRPGQIYIGEIPKDLNKENVILKQIGDGLYKNHGYFKGTYNRQDCGYFGSDDGLYRLTYEDDKWNLIKIMDGHIGEVALIDIDNDGKEEIMTIEPFHGNKIHVYKEINNKYEIVYTYPYEIDFAHALVGTYLNNKPCFIAGIRRINCELFVLTYEDGAYKVNMVDKGVGPANLDVVKVNGKDYILAANHTKNEAAIYEVKGS